MKIIEGYGAFEDENGKDVELIDGKMVRNETDEPEPFFPEDKEGRVVEGILRQYGTSTFRDHGMSMELENWVIVTKDYKIFPLKNGNFEYI